MNRMSLVCASVAVVSLPLLLACEDLSVTPVPVSRVEVVPEAATLTVGESLGLAAIPADANGTRLTDRSVTWRVRDSSLAIVSSTGTVHALQAGVTVVEAVTEGKMGVTEIRILRPEPAEPPEEDPGEPTGEGTEDGDDDVGDAGDDGAEGGEDDDEDDEDDEDDDTADPEPGNSDKKKGKKKAR